MSYHIPTYEEILDIIKTDPHFKIQDPFYNSLFFGTKLELQYLPSQLEEGERIYYMTSGNWKGQHRLIVVTGNRILILDKKLWRRGRHSQIEIDKINSIDVAGGFFFSSLTIRTGNDDPDEISGLWGSDADRLHKAYERVRRDYRQKYESSSIRTNDVEAKSSDLIKENTETSDKVKAIKQLYELLKLGAITQEEYDNQKEELLKSLNFIQEK